MVDWSTVKSLSLTFGPIVVPWLYGQYRKLRIQIASAGPGHPPPPKIYNALSILGLAMAVFILLSFPFWQPENLFTLTQSRMQTPTNVMFERLRLLRPGKQLDYADETFKIRLQMTEARCLYMKYGPDAILDCLWCSPMDPRSYVFYSLPNVLGPHIVNLLAVGLATSAFVVGKEGSRWRFHAALGGLALAALDLYYCYSWDWSFNAMTKSGDQLVFFYWRMRSLRPILIAAFDAVLASVLWFSSTGRFFVQPVSSAEKVNALTQRLATVQAKISSAGILQNTVARNTGLRQKSDQYWQKEVQLVQDVLTEPEVAQSVNKAMSQRSKVARAERDAKTFAESLIDGELKGSPATQQA